MTPESALYIGSVLHRRLKPRGHRFRYGCFWLFLDLDELPTLSHRLRLFSYNRANVFSLHDRDHGDGSATPLRVQIDRLLRAADIDPDGGTVRLLTMPRTFGYSFNPLSVYFCYHRDGTLAAVIYQVHNTFGGRHAYVIPAQPGQAVLRQRCDKAFYVSPFMDMALRYDFRVVGPDQQVAIAIRTSDRNSPVLDASLIGARAALSDAALLRLALAMPAITLKVLGAIHWEAVRLWLKGLRLRPRPAAPASMPPAPSPFPCRKAMWQSPPVGKRGRA